MGTGTLSEVTGGGSYAPSDINQFRSALDGHIIPRRSGVGTNRAGDVGRPGLIFDTIRARVFEQNGQDINAATSSLPVNRIISGATTALSSLPNFISISSTSGDERRFFIEGGTTALEISINGTNRSLTSRLTFNNFTLAPSTNNTLTINSTVIHSVARHTHIIGQADSQFTILPINNVGSEISGRLDQIVAFRTPSGELIQSYVGSATQLFNTYRNYYIPLTGAPVTPQGLANGATLTMLNIGWVFLDTNLTTIDVTYTTPITAYTQPTTGSEGDYWFDLSDEEWKRHNGTTYITINRTLIGEVVADSTQVVGYRCHDFQGSYESDDNLRLHLRASATQVEGLSERECINVYGTELSLSFSKPLWNITRDLVTGVTETSNTDYYLYIADTGQTHMALMPPHRRSDLKGYYHPFESWRCIGVTYNDIGSNLAVATKIDASPHETANFRNVQARGVNARTVGRDTTAIRVINDEYIRGSWVRAVSNEICLSRGAYSFDIRAKYSTPLSGGRSFLSIHDTEANFSVFQDMVSNAQEGSGQNRYEGTALLQGNLIFDGTRCLRIDHYIESGALGDAPTHGISFNNTSHPNEIYMVCSIQRLDT